MSPVRTEPRAPSLRQVEADRVGGVARRGHDPDLGPGGVDDFAVHQGLSPVAVRRILGAHGRSGQFGEPGGGGGVVRVPVRNQDELDGAGLGQFLQVRLIQRAGIHHDGAGRPGGGNHVGVGPVQAHRPRVGGQPEAGQLCAAHHGAGVVRDHSSIFPPNDGTRTSGRHTSSSTAMTAGRSASAMALAHSRRSDSTRMMPSSTWPRHVNSSSARPAAGSAPGQQDRANDRAHAPDHVVEAQVEGPHPHGVRVLRLDQEQPVEALVPEEEGLQDPHEDQHNPENDTQNLNKSRHAPYCAPASGDEARDFRPVAPGRLPGR